VKKFTKVCGKLGHPCSHFQPSGYLAPVPGPLPSRPFGASASPRPTTLSARAAQRLAAAGPLDAVTLMRDVCQVERLQSDAAERMALALLSSHPEFVRLPSGHWALAAAAEGTAGEFPARALGAAPSVPTRGGVADAAPISVPRLGDIPFAVVDVETTGTRAGGGDRITEIAIAVVQGGAVVERWSQLVNPERSIPPYISALTRITWDMVRDAPCFRHICHEVIDRLRGRVFVAHNAAFDWRFVAEELRCGASLELAGPRLCTVKLARVLLPDLPRRSLDHLTRYFGIDIEARHRAGGDAEATAHALCRMLTIAERLGVHTWEDLHALVSRPSERRARTASDRRRRAFPLPATDEGHIA
jgi:DNA polymerase III subunit epsilon